MDLRRLLCMTCYKGSSSGACCAGFTASATCNRYQEQYACPGDLIHAEPYNCHECAKTCMGCMEMRVKFKIVDREKVVHLL